jgi:hypothetical protein
MKQYKCQAGCRRDSSKIMCRVTEGCDVQSAFTHAARCDNTRQDDLYTEVLRHVDLMSLFFSMTE